jgi:hypothetical protein
MFDKYTQLMKSRCEEQLKRIIDEDSYRPYIIEQAEEYQRIIKICQAAEDKMTPSSR